MPIRPLVSNGIPSNLSFSDIAQVERRARRISDKAVALDVRHLSDLGETFSKDLHSTIAGLEAMERFLNDFQR